MALKTLLFNWVLSVFWGVCLDKVSLFKSLNVQFLLSWVLVFAVSEVLLNSQEFVIGVWVWLMVLDMCNS